MSLLVNCNHCKDVLLNEEAILIDDNYYCCDCLLRFQEGWEK